MACLRDCFGMHANALPERVMKGLRDHIEKHPKNVSFSEDNGHWVPPGARVDVKVYPRDSAVHTDHRHGWSRKWSWAPGHGHGWLLKSEWPRATFIFFTTAEDRPILFFVYLCPTEWYKGAELASSTDQEQIGRKHLSKQHRPCLTCDRRDPPRESPCTPTFACTAGRDSPTGSCPTCCSTCLCESCPTDPQHSCSICPGTRAAPSRSTSPWPIYRWRNLCLHLLAWDKSERVGEASNPGPEPPQEIWLRRKNGQRDPLRLCTQNGGWVWNVHCVPPLRVAKRPTPHEALRNWLTKHEPAIEPDSAEAARQLAKAWEEFPIPQPIRRTRSLPHREIKSMMSETSLDSSPPRETPLSGSQPDPPVRKRLRGKTSLPSSPTSPPRFCPADAPDAPASQSSEGRPEPYGCWDEIYDVLRKPVLVDRNIPRELKTLWQRLVLQLLSTDQSRTDVYPIASDLVFILPKLILSHPPGKEKAKDRLHRIQECLRRASQGEWPYLIARTLELDTPRYEPDESQPLATGPDSLPPRTAKRLYKAASQGQLGKAWRQLRAPPPVHVGPKQWEEAVAKLTPHEHQEGSVPLREDIAPERWHPTPREYSHAISKLKRNKAADAGGWTTETAQSCTDHPHLKQALLAWLHTHATATSGPARRRGLWRTHRLVCLDKGGGAIQAHTHWHDLGQTSQPPFAATGQVRLGTAVSQKPTIWDWNPPGGPGYDYGDQSPPCPAPGPCGGLFGFQERFWIHQPHHMCQSSPRALPPQPSLAGHGQRAPFRTSAGRQSG